jgi:hypothetical protein
MNGLGAVTRKSSFAMPGLQPTQVQLTYCRAPAASTRPLIEADYCALAITDEASPLALRSTRKSSQDSTAPVVLLEPSRMMMLIVRAQPASNSPAMKPHIATASTVSLHCNLRAEQH